jgi:hypothetical protein
MGVSIERSLSWGVVAAAALAVVACNQHSDVKEPIVGTWIVKDSKAPFPFHMYVFNADGTMQQANPDAGDAHGSDSDGKGVWAADGDRIRGKWVEIMADRATHRFTGRGELSFDIAVRGDHFEGPATMRIYDPASKLAVGPIATGLSGERVAIR